MTHDPPFTRAFAMTICVAMLGFVASLGCRPSANTVTVAIQAPTEPSWFEDVTEKVGLNFVHDAGPGGQYHLPEIMGSGAAVIDLDVDGKFDGLYFVQNGGPQSESRNRLFRRTSGGKYEDISAGSGVDVAGFGMGVAVGDVNNDGLPDLFLTQFGGNRLFLN